MLNACETGLNHQPEELQGANSVKNIPNQDKNDTPPIDLAISSESQRIAVSVDSNLSMDFENDTIEEIEIGEPEYNFENFPHGSFIGNSANAIRIESSDISLTRDSRYFLPGTQQAVPDFPEMKVSEKQKSFSKNIHHRNYFDSIAAIVSEMSHLEIVTIIEDEDDPLFESDCRHQTGLLGQRIISKIELLEGRIETVIGSRFIENSNYEKIRFYHQEQLKNGQQAIIDNLSALKEAIAYLKELSYQEPGN